MKNQLYDYGFIEKLFDMVLGKTLPIEKAIDTKYSSNRM